MKKAIPVFLTVFLAVILLAFLPMNANAADEGPYLYVITDGEATITDCGTNIRGDVTIPSQLGGYPVTCIGESAFRLCGSLTSVTIPDSVTRIEDYAFYQCTGLTSVAIPDSVTSIGREVFSYCSKLQYNIYDNCNYLGNANNPHFVFVKAVDKNIKTCELHSDTKIIAGSAFHDCIGLTSINIPDSVTSIGKYGFGNCFGLTIINIPDSVTSIGDYAFYGCNNLTSVTISDNVTSIEDGTFYQCSELTSIDIPDSVTSIGTSAFFYCSKLTSINIPDSVTSIGNSVFSGCNKLQYNIYDNGKYLGNTNNPYLVFAGTVDSKITACEIRSDTKIIAGSAFYGCSSLSSIIIPDSIISIGKSAFSRCSSLTSITFQGDAPAIADCFENVIATAYYPRGNATWTEEVRQNYGGTITWVAYGDSIPGDLDGDEEINNKDVEYLLWYTLFPEDYLLSANADFDGDGEVNNKDVEHLLWYTLFPEDYPLS